MLGIFQNEKGSFRLKASGDKTLGGGFARTAGSQSLTTDFGSYRTDTSSMTGCISTWISRIASVIGVRQFPRRDSGFQTLSGIGRQTTRRFFPLTTTN